MFSSTNEEFSYDYEYNPIPRPIINYSEYEDSTNYYNFSKNCKPHKIFHEKLITTKKIYINPYFRSDTINKSNLSSIDRPTVICPKKKCEKPKAQRKQYQQEKEILFKNQLELSSKSIYRHPSPDYWEHKDEKLERLYKEYSQENIFKNWKPLLIQDCFELYQYAFNKYSEKSMKI